jgi:hypothetical protein
MTVLLIPLVACLVITPAVAQTLIELKGPEGQAIYVNTHEITSIREPRSMNKTHFAKGTNCVVMMTGGTFVAVLDRCVTVLWQIQNIKPLPHNE